VAGCDTLHLQILGGVASQLQHLSSEVLCMNTRRQAGELRVLTRRNCKYQVLEQQGLMQVRAQHEQQVAQQNKPARGALPAPGRT